MKEIKIADLKALYQPAASDAAKWAVILLHGHGASMADLAPLTNALESSSNYHWFFPDAPLSLPHYDIFPARTWFPIDEQKLLQGICPWEERHFVDACQKVGEFVTELQKEYRHMILGGFSQGSMLALHLALTELKDIYKLALFSTTLVYPERWDLKSSSNLKVFQSHGLGDPVLPISAARQVKDLLIAAKISVEYREFSGGHEIPLSVLQDFDRFLELSSGVR